MEELLNKLIEKGWKPRGYKMQGIHCSKNRFTLYLPNMIQGNYSIRDLVSKSSGLWQFVCDREHRFINERNYDGVSLDKRLKNPYVDYDGVNTEYEWITGLDYQYWVIESSLKDEDELEQFLLDNIKIDEKKS